MKLLIIILQTPFAITGALWYFMSQGFKKGIIIGQGLSHIWLRK